MPEHPIDPAAVELDEIREALRHAVHTRSLRGVARDVGVSPTGLFGMIKGAAPYSKTYEKLVLWYATYLAEGSGMREPSAAALAGLVRTLLRRIPQREQPRAYVRVLKGFREAFDIGGVELPPWHAEVEKILLEKE